MGLLDFFKRKSAVGGTGQTQLVSSAASWMPNNSKAYAKEGYAKNVIAYRCIEIVSKSVASIPIEVYVGEEEAEDHPLAKLLAKPNPMQTGTAFTMGNVAYRLITGNTYIERLGPDNQPPVELWTWTPYNMKVVADSAMRAMPRGYLWSNGKEKTAWGVNHVDGSSDVLHWRTFNPINLFYGMSPLEAAAWAVDQHNAASQWNKKMLDHGTVPDGLLTTEGTINEEQFKQLKKRIEKNHQGAQNARRAMILDGGLRWQQMGLTAKDMDWLEGKNLSSREIAAAYGVPTQVIPIQGDQTFANYEQARLALWEDTVIPLAEDYITSLNEWLVPAFGDNVTLKLNFDEVPALEVKRAQKWQSLQNTNFLSLNEKRAELNYAPKGDPEDESNPHNQLWLPAGMLPITEDEEIEEGPDDEEQEEEEGSDLAVALEEMEEDLRKLAQSDLGQK